MDSQGAPPNTNHQSYACISRDHGLATAKLLNRSQV